MICASRASTHHTRTAAFASTRQISRLSRVRASHDNIRSLQIVQSRAITERVTQDMVDQAFKEASTSCAGRTDAECAVQWDSAYEIYIAYVHQNERERWQQSDSEDDSASWEMHKEERTYDL